MSRHLYYHGDREISEAEALDRNGMLKDGITLRVRTQMRDTAAARDARAQAYDAYDADIQEAWRNTNPRGRSSEATGEGEHGTPRGQQPGDSCTIDGRSGHLKMVNGELRCVPDKTDSADRRPLLDSSGQPAGHRPGFAFVNDVATREARARMYAAKDAEYENAWRGPNATCPSCQGSGKADDGGECETCRGEGVLNPS